MKHVSNLLKSYHSFGDLKHVGDGIKQGITKKHTQSLSQEERLQDVYDSSTKSVSVRTLKIPRRELERRLFITEYKNDTSVYYTTIIVAIIESGEFDDCIANQLLAQDFNVLHILTMKFPRRFIGKMHDPKNVYTNHSLQEILGKYLTIHQQDQVHDSLKRAVTRVLHVLIQDGYLDTVIASVSTLDQIGDALPQGPILHYIKSVSQVLQDRHDHLHGIH
jgi:hypothetical protein